MLNSLNSFIKGFAAKVLLVLLILSFGVWGIGDVLRRGVGHKDLATVGSAPISIEDFKQALDREKSNIQRTLGKQYSPEILKSMHVPEQVLDKLITRSLVLQEAHAYGLIASDNDVARMIHTNPAFHDDKGHFDKNIYSARLRSAGLSEKYYVEQLRQQTAAQILIGVINSHHLEHPLAAETLYKSRNQQRNVTLYVMRESLVPAITNPADNDIKTFYESHHAMFSEPEYRTLSYVSFNLEDMKPDLKVAPEELQAAYDERMDEFRFDERREVEQLLYSSEDSAKKALAMAQAGKSFQDVANGTDAMNKNAVSLGKISHDALFDDASGVVFKLEKGGISQPINSPFGWHIFKVTDVEMAGVKPLEEVKEQLEKELTQQKRNETIDKLANNLDDMIAGGSTLTEASKELGLALHTLPPVDTSGLSPHNVKVQLPLLDHFLDTAFALDDQTESSMHYSQDGTYFIIRVDKITPTRIKPLDEVKDQVLEAWKNDQRAQKLSLIADDMAKKLANQRTRRNIANQNNIEMVGASGVKRDNAKVADYELPPQMMADIFVRNTGHITAPYLVGNDKRIIAEVSSIKQAALPDDEPKRKAMLTSITDELTAKSQKELVDQYVTYLKQKYPVSINESVFSATVQEQ